LVRLTTADKKWPDEDCLLGPADWCELVHLSTVAYSTAMVGPVGARLEAAIAAGTSTVITSPPAPALRAMIIAGHQAKGLSPLAKRHLAPAP